MSGSCKPVVGDLVYCRERCSEKMTNAAGIECEDEFSNDEYACNDTDDDSHAEVLAEKNESVKVKTHAFSFTFLIGTIIKFSIFFFLLKYDKLDLLVLKV